MAEIGSTSPEHQGPSENQGGILSSINERMNWPATVAASVAATLAASVAIHEIHFPDGSAPDAIQKFLTPDAFGLNYHTRTVSHHTGRHIVSRRAALPLSESNTYTDLGDQRYARDFSQDPNAGEYVESDRLDGIIRELSGSIRLGYDIKSIQVTGYASAEDNSPDGGLATPSEKNLRLAQTRASTVMGELKQAIAENPDLSKAAQGISFKYGPPVEQELTEQQVETIDSMARKAGFDNSRQLIDAWNLGEAGMSETDGKALHDILGKARKVDVHVAFAPSDDIVVDKKYCVRYDVTDIQTHKQHQRGPLPLPLPIPIPILRLRRRSGEDSEADELEEKAGGPDPEPMGDGVTETPAAESAVPEGNGNLAAGADEISGASLPSRSELEALEDRLLRGSRVANTVAGIGGALLAAGLLFVNVSGENCRENGHTPRPLLVDAVWEAIDYGSGRGADVSQTISFGIPFVSSAQVNIDKVQGNIWGLNGEKACEKTAPSTGEKAPRPACSQVDIVRRNGKTVTKRTVYQAPPISTRRIIRQHR